MHQALYRKWRPKTFDDVCGQEHITSILRYEAEHGAFSHAYLFCGSRGTGKTTCAKILSKVMNCEHPVGGNPCGVCPACVAIENGSATDVLEMDAASNNGVDNIRDIRDEVVYSPSSLKYRVYIIDEVHMLSTSAFNALLKTLEEPPAHVFFILATTELHKLPATIISRCQRFDFRRISTEHLVARISYIAEQEGMTLSPDAARMLAKLSQGGMRDAISLLELCAGAKREITTEVVEESVGLSGKGAIAETVNAILGKDYDTLFARIDEVVRSSKDLMVFWQDLIAFYRDLLVLKSTKNAAAYLDVTDGEMEELQGLAKCFRKETLTYHCNLLEEALFSMQRANAVKRMVAELTLVRLCDEALDYSNEALLARIVKLEERGAASPAPAVADVAVSPAKTEVPHPPAKQPVKAAPAAASVPSAQSAEGASLVRRPIRNWMEVVERISRGAPMVASFVRASRGYTTAEGGLLVQFENPFALQMMSGEDASERLRAAAEAVLRTPIPPNKLQLEALSAGEKLGVLDEILNASDEE